MKQFEQYNHHGKDFFVRTDLKGQHRAYFLCFECEKSDNCTIAQDTLKNCQKHNIVTPVLGCPNFVSNQPDIIYELQIHDTKKDLGFTVCYFRKGCSVDAIVKAIKDLQHPGLSRLANKIAQHVVHGMRYCGIKFETHVMTVTVPQGQKSIYDNYIKANDEGIRYPLGTTFTPRQASDFPEDQEEIERFGFSCEEVEILSPEENVK